MKQFIKIRIPLHSSLLEMTLLLMSLLAMMATAQNSLPNCPVTATYVINKQIQLSYTA